MHSKTRALKAAFPQTVPIFAGFTFLGMAYGIFMHSMGFSFVWPMLMALTIFAGSMEFVTVSLLCSAFNPLYAFLLALMVNARHLFYGVSMLEKYKGTGKKKWYLIYGMCDESFTINYSAKIPEDVDKGWFMFFVTLLNQCYWVMGAALGGLVGGLLPINTKGIEFVMTALFVVIFLDQFKLKEQKLPGIIGLSASFLSLLVFGGENFILPAMALMLAVLTCLKKPLSKGEGPS